MRMLADLKAACRQRCPRCGDGLLFKPGLTLDVNERCAVCGLPLAENDNGDGPIVFVLFILCFALGPAAVLTDKFFAPPLWVHIVVWPVLAIGMTGLLLRPAKTLVLLLQYRHLPDTWEASNDSAPHDHA